MNPRWPKRWWLGLFLASVGLAGCGSDGSPQDTDDFGIGFIFVGARDDLGYNEAAWQASESLARAFPDVQIDRLEHVPENDEAIEALETLIDQGADLLFATSFGHLDAARTVAAAHGDVVIVHQGGREAGATLDNLGTYWGTHHEILYAAGLAAAGEAQAVRIGFIAAFPIPATFSNVNALLLGAQSVDPEATLELAYTDEWCDIEAQLDALEVLIDRGIDVLAMHQDCTRALLEQAEATGLPVFGYHADGSEVAPTAWLTAAVWTWDDLYADIAETVINGRFAGSVYDNDFRGTLANDSNPAGLAEPGARVAPEVVTAMHATLEDFARGRRTPFDGPIGDRDGGEGVQADASLTVEQADTMDWLVAGVSD